MEEEIKNNKNLPDGKTLSQSDDNQPKQEATPETKTDAPVEKTVSEPVSRPSEEKTPAVRGRSNFPPREDRRAGQRPRGRGKEEQSEFERRVLQVDRVARTVRGGKRIRFRALVISGNRMGKVGIGVGKASEVVDAVSKASRFAQKHMMDVPLKNDTIPYPVEVKLGSAHIILKPAKSGTSIVAGGAIRTVCELAGVKNIVGKILGSANKINNSKATLEAFRILSKQVEMGKTK